MDMDSLDKFVYKQYNWEENGNDGEKCFACPMCPSTFTVKYNLERHIRTHTGERPYECQCCPMSFFRLDKLAAHERTAHATEILSFECNECSEVFSSRIQLRLHRKAHDGAHECEICGKVFTMRKVLVRHKTVHATEKTFVCPNCGKAFGTRSALKLHYRKHSGEKPYKCEICEKDFAQKAQLNSHNKRIHTITDKLHECAICDLQYSTVFELMKHRRIHIGDKNYECEICAKTFQSKTRLEAHKRWHNGEKPFVCEVCGKKFGAARYLRVHNSLHYDKNNSGPNSNVGVSNPPSTSDIIYVDGTYCECPICHVKFKQEFRLKRHLVVHSGEKNPYKRKSQSVNDILVPEIEFGESNSDLKVVETVNLVTEAGIEIQYEQYDPHEVPENGFYACDDCGQTFHELAKLNLHKRSHESEKAYACDICGDIFSEENELHMHRQTHMVPQNEYCDKKPVIELSEIGKYHVYQEVSDDKGANNIENTSNVVTYECIEQVSSSNSKGTRSRTNTEKYEKCCSCELCGKAFTTSARLRVHYRIHNGEKPFSCKTCQKSFSEKRYLNIHMRTHTGEKPYVCEYCPRRFADMSARNSHRKLHTGERPFECPKCDKKFLKGSNLKTHLATHNELKHACDICGVMFGTRFNLVEHKKIHSVPS